MKSLKNRILVIGKVTLIFLFFLIPLFYAPSEILAQEAVQEDTMENPLDDKDWALQFEIDNNFTCIQHNFTVHEINCQNVLFKLNENKTDIVILAAHYDSRARATKDPNHVNRSDPVPGANDGASGCSVLIELANNTYQRRYHLNCQIWFLFFDAEDQGEDSGGYGINGWDWCE